MIAPLVVPALLVLSALALVVAVRALRFCAPSRAVRPSSSLEVDAEGAAARLAGALAIPTLSNRDRSRMDRGAFLALHDYLQKCFPGVHQTLEFETVNELSLLYRWPGSDPSLPPLLLMAHLDVVPVAPGTEGDWTHPPFGGVVADGFVWGRGSLDVKSGVTGILEAAERLLAEGFTLRRTLYIAFGHDEEVGGEEGMARIAALLSERGVRIGCVLDEGGAVSRGVLPGVAGEVAMVGIAEKGYVNLTLSARAEGGHSSMPGRRTAIGALGSGLSRLQERPCPADLSFTALTFSHLGRALPFRQRIAWANLWLFGPLLKRRLATSAKLDAGQRTTIAPTMVNSGVQENVLPAKAEAVVNCRILPGDTIASVADHVRRAVADPSLTVEVRGEGSEPSPVADPASPEFARLAEAIAQAAGNPALPVLPYLVVGATDSRYWCGRADQVLRFLFNRLEGEDFRRIHGTDERIAVTNYASTVRFYAQLIRNFQDG